MRETIEIGKGYLKANHIANPEETNIATPNGKP